MTGAATRFIQPCSSEQVARPALADFLPELCVALYNAVPRAMVANRWSCNGESCRHRMESLKLGISGLKYAMDAGILRRPAPAAAALDEAPKREVECILAATIRAVAALLESSSAEDLVDAGVSPALFLASCGKFKTCGRRRATTTDVT